MAFFRVHGRRPAAWKVRPADRVITIAVAAAAICTTAGAEAAVRQCRQPVTSEIVTSPTEEAGKQQALRSWGEKVRRLHGEPYVGWRVATRKVLGCRPSKDGPAAGLQCVAFAAPCRIEQVPGTPPRGTPPRRLRPGPTIET